MPGRYLGDLDAFFVIKTEGPDRAKVEADVRKALGGVKAEVPVGTDTRNVRADIEAAIRRALAGMHPQVKITPDDAGFRAKAEADVKRDMAGVDGKVKITPDVSGLPAALAALQSRLQSISGGKTGLADLIDINVPQGKIITQLQRLRILVQRSGLSDMMGVNLNDSQIREQLDKISRLSATVEVNADTSNVGDTIVQLQAQIAALSDTLGNLSLNVTDTKGLAQVAALQAKVLAVQKALGNMMMEADTSKLDAQIAAKEAQLATLQRKMSDLQLNADDAKAVAKIAALEKQVAGLYGRLDHLTADVDINAALTKIYALEAELQVLQSDAATVEISANISKFQAAIGAVETELAALRAQSAEIKIGAEANIDPGALAKMASTLLNVKDSMDKITIAASNSRVAIAGMDDEVVKTGKDAGKAFKVVSGGGWFGLGGQIAGIKAWHLALDSVLEATIAVTGAAIALGAGLAAVAEPAKNIGQRLQAVRTVSSALGVDIPPLTGKFDALAKAMVPQTIELYGAALRVVQSQSGDLRRSIQPVVDLFDTWAAKIVQWVGNQHKFSQVVQSGLGYLSQFGTAVGHLVDAITNLLSKDPGVAHYFLDLIQGLTGALDLFSKLPGPVITTALALHAVYLWTKVLAVGPLIGMARAIGILKDKQAEALVNGLKFKNLIGAALASPWITTLVLLAAAIADMGITSKQASNATRAFISNLEQGINSLSAGDAILGISKAIGQINTQISNTTAASEYAHGWNTLGQTFRSTGLDARKTGSDIASSFADLFSGHFVKAVEDSGRALKDAFVPGGGASIAAAQDVSKLRDEIVKLGHAQGDLVQAMGHFIGQGHTAEQALALLDLAGVRANDTYSIMVEKVNNLVTGYKNVTGTGGSLENSVNAVTFSALQQQERVSQLNSAWDTFFQTISGGESGFVTFAQQTVGLYSAMSTGGAKLRDSNGKISSSISQMGTTAKGATGTLTGLNIQSLNLRNTFIQSADAANKQLDNLNLLANAAGMGQKGVNLLNQAARDMVASLLPAAQHSAALTTILYALAQRGGYQGADSFRALAEWVGKTRDPLKNLDGITTTLTVHAGNLVKDVQNLSLALGTTLNNAMSAVIFTFSHGQQALTGFADSLAHGYTNSKLQQTAALNLASTLVKLTGNTQQAHDEFITFATKLGLTKDQADTLWKEITGKLTPALNDQANKVLPNVKNMFTTFAQVGLNDTRTAANNLWNQIVGRLGPSLSNLGNLASGPAKAKFIDWAENGLHLSQQKAYALWNELVTLQAKINALHGKNISVVMVGNASYTVKDLGTGTVQAAGTHTAAGRGATGLYISQGTGPTADDVPIWVSRGEYVQQAKAVNKYGVKAMDAVNQGRAVIAYASGGLVPKFAGGGPITGLYGFGQSVENSLVSNEQRSLISAMTKSLKASEAAARAAAQAAAARNAAVGLGISASPARTGSVAVEQAFARSILFAYGWGQDQMPPLIALWNRECVPLNVRILTRRGWLTYDEVKAGDETIGYNFETGRNEWTRITAVNKFGPTPVARFGNKYWSTECTWNHCWLAEDMGTQVRYGPRPERKRLEWREVVKSESLVELRELRKAQRVVLARPAHSDSELPISIREAALLGWIAGDGWVTELQSAPQVCPECGWLPFVASGYSDSRIHGHPQDKALSVRSHRIKKHGFRGKSFMTRRGRGSKIGISQSKPEHFGAIEDALADVPGVCRGIYQADARWHPVKTWQLSHEYSRDLLARAGNPKTDAVAQVLAMSDDQRDAWLEAITAAEGTRCEGRTVLYQDDGPVADAIELAIYLSGRCPSRTKDTRGAGKSWAIRSVSPHIGGQQRNRLIEDAGVKPVWCPTTELGSWTAQDGGRVFLTGNSGWNPYAVNASSGAAGIPQALGHGNVFALGDYQAQIRWGLSYIKSRYGSPAAAWAHEVSAGWYGQGGLVPRMASGGSVASWDSRARTAESGETRDYAALRAAYLSDLAHAKPGSWTAGHRAGITRELGTLGRRQSAEVAAYNAVLRAYSQSGATHLATTAREVATVTRDIDLSHSHPGITRALQYWLGLLDSLGGVAPAGSGSGTGNTGGGAGGVAGPLPTLPPLPKLTTAQFMARLRGAQAAETRDYAGLRSAYLYDLAHARKGSWTYGHRAGIRSELATLAKRQAAEAAAFGVVLHGGGSKASLSAFASRLSALATTSGDADLTHSHPGRSRAFRYWLAVLEQLAGGAPGGVTGATNIPPPSAYHFGNLSTASAFAKELQGLQTRETQDYTGLVRLFRGNKSKTIASELATLAKRQAAEVLAYHAILGSTKGNLSAATLAKLGSAARSEASTTQDAALVAAHPGGTAGLRYWLGALSALAGKKVPPVDTGGTHIVVSPPARPLNTIRARAFSFDNGGYLPPRSMTLAWNGLSTPEPVGAPAGEQHIHVHVSNHGVIGSRAEVDNWLNGSIDRLARQGRLKYAFTRSFSAT